MQWIKLTNRMPNPDEHDLLSRYVSKLSAKWPSWLDPDFLRFWLDHLHYGLGKILDALSALGVFGSVVGIGLAVWGILGAPVDTRRPGRRRWK